MKACSDSATTFKTGLLLLKPKQLPISCPAFAKCLVIGKAVVSVTTIDAACKCVEAIDASNAEVVKVRFVINVFFSLS